MSAVDPVFRALADPTRRELVERLAEQRSTVGELAEPLPMSLAAVSKHVRVLEEAGLVRREVIGRTHLIHLQPGALAGARDWLAACARAWEARLDALEAVLDDPATDHDEESSP